MYGVSQDKIDMLFEMGYDLDEITMMIYDPEIMQDCLEETRMYFEECN